MAMDILTIDQMKHKQLQLLQIYTQSQINFKLNFQQLLEVKAKGRNLFCFRKAQTNNIDWIQKNMPFQKEVHSLNLEQEQNGIFKAISFVFLLIIYKAKPKPNFQVLERLKCSLYSSDVNLIEIRNHSFNKKIKSDTIKSVIAIFFKQIERFLETQMKKSQNLNIQDLLAFAFDKNDLVVEGLHLFYRNILSKFEVGGADSCIEVVKPDEAIKSLIYYFQIDCRILNNLYLFQEAGIFLAIIGENIFFGRYFQNQLFFMENSDKESNGQERPNVQAQLITQSKLLKKQNQTQTNDVKISDFLLKTDRNTQDNFFDQTTQQASTQSFQLNKEIKLGKKTSLQLYKSCIKKIKSRIQNQKINEISSQEEETDPKKDQILGINMFAQKNNLKVESQFLNLRFNEQCVDSGADFLVFSKKQLHPFSAQNNFLVPKIIINQAKQSQSNLIYNPSKINQELLNTNEIKTTAIKKQSYQRQNWSQRTSSENMKKKQMKTSKNQIQVMDGTASQVNLRKSADQIQKQNNHDQVRNQPRLLTLGEYQKSQLFKKCTCHIEKMAKIKLNSKTVEILVSFHNKLKPAENLIDLKRNRKISTQIFQPLTKKDLGIIKKNSEGKNLLFKKNSNIQAQNLKAQKKNTKSPSNKQGQIKSPQFLKFLKKDKSELIKKITQKRSAKKNITNGQIVSQKNFQQGQKNIQQNKKYVKQSMFVGSYHLPYSQKHILRIEQQNKSVTPNSSIDRYKKNKSKSSKTHAQLNGKKDSYQGVKLLKVNNSKSYKNVPKSPDQINLKSCTSNIEGYIINSSYCGGMPRSPIAIKNFPTILNCIPTAQQGPVVANSHLIKPYDLYIKR